MKSFKEIFEAMSPAYREVVDEDKRIFSMLKYIVGALLEKHGLLDKYGISEIMVRDGKGEIPAIKFDTKKFPQQPSGTVWVGWDDKVFKGVVRKGVASKNIELRRSGNPKKLSSEGAKLYKLMDKIVSEVF